MRPLLLAAGLALAAAAPGRAAERQWLDVMGGAGLTGNVFVSETEGGTTFNRGRYRVSARVRTARFGDQGPSAKGTREEWSAALTRELYHVTVTGRLGTSPPNSQRASYHLAGGEAWLTFYGWTLGPEHPELSAEVWESSGPAPSPQSLDRTWVTRVGGVYSNIDNHLEGTASLPALVENVWQLDLSETWRGRTTLLGEFGFDRLNKETANGVRRTVKSNIDYPGNFLPLSGWPNNWAGAKLSQRAGAFTLTAAGTRLNQLDNTLDVLYAAEAAWTPGESSWSLRAAYEHLRERGRFTREGLSLGLSKRW